MVSTIEKQQNIDYDFLEKVENDVKDKLIKHLSPSMFFHNLEHTLRVKANVQTIAKGENVTNRALELLIIAALFHDVGYVDTYQDHEEKSQVIATQYLQKHDYPQEDIETIQRLIDVTKMDKIPADLLEKIICDADTAHVGQKKYRRNIEQLKEERSAVLGQTFIHLDWEKENLNFLQTHRFYTETAKKLYGPRKQKNTEKIKKTIAKAKVSRQKEIQDFSISKNKAAQVMFKAALRNHIDLTSIADQKSNIMLSVNALLLTIGMPVFASYLSDKVYLLVPSLLFMLTCILTMVFATLSTRPIKMDGETNLDKIKYGKTNLFFFGNFYKIDLETYQRNVMKVIAHKDTMDKSLINDLYYLGHALGDKFRYLRTCYNVFIIGIILSLIAFLISYAIYVPDFPEVIKDNILTQ